MSYLWQLIKLTFHYSVGLLPSAALLELLKSSEKSSSKGQAYILAAWTMFAFTYLKQSFDFAFEFSFNLAVLH